MLSYGRAGSDNSREKSFKVTDSQWSTVEMVGVNFTSGHCKDVRSEVITGNKKDSSKVQTTQRICTRVTTLVHSSER